MGNQSAQQAMPKEQEVSTQNEEQESFRATYLTLKKLDWPLNTSISTWRA